MRVLVTGGAGYVGSELVRALAADRRVDEVVVYDNLSRKHRGLFVCGPLTDEKIRFIRGDILDTRRLGLALDGVDVVYHLAARVTTPFAEDDPHAVEQVNHWGTAELTYLVERLGIRRLVYTSSASVYGAACLPFDLHVRPAPQTWYGASKLRGEAMVARLDGMVEVYIPRCGNIYGYGRAMRFDAVINRFVFEAMYEERITVEGNGSQKRAFIEIGQTVRALLCMGLEQPECGRYDLVTRNLSVESIASEVRAIFPETEVLHVQQDMQRRSLEVNPDPRLAALGLELPGVAFRDELRTLASHFSFRPAPRSCATPAEQ